MKLHLPLSLRAALLAAMLCLPFAQAENVVKQDGNVIQMGDLKDSEDGSVDITWDSTRTFLDEKLDGEVTITVSGTGIVSLSRGQLGNKDGNITINVHDGGRFTLALGEIAKDGGNATINVGSGGVLEYVFGTVAYNNMQGEGMKPVQIILDGGRFECGSGSLARGANGITGAADVTVKNHGEFNLGSSLQVGYGFSGGSAVAKFFVEQDGKVTQRGYLGKSDCVGKMIKEADGSYKKDESGNYVYEYGDPGSYDVTIEVKGTNAVYELAGGFIGGKENTEKTGTELENKIHITVGQGGLFKQTGGSLAVGDELEKLITVLEDGVFEQAGGINNADITVTGEYKMTEGTVNGRVSIEEGGKWLLNGGAVNGEITIEVGGNGEQTNGSFSEGSSLFVRGNYTMSGGTNGADITVEGGGVFEQTGGVSNANIAVAGEYKMTEGTVNGRVSIEEGGKWLLNGGAVNGEITIEVGGNGEQTNGSFSEGSSLFVRGNYTMSGGTNGADITVEGGGVFEQTGGVSNANIAVAGEYKMTEGTVNGRVSIEEGGKWLLNGGAVNGEITIEVGGNGEQTNGSFSEGSSLFVRGNYTMSGGTNGADITVEGGKFIHESGQVSGEVTITSGEYALSEHGEFAKGAHVSINGGSFSAEQGSVLGGMTLDVNGGALTMHNATLNSSAVNVSAGGVFTISGATTRVENSAINLKEDATLELKDDVKLSMEQLHLTAKNSRVKQVGGDFIGDVTLDADTTYTQTGGAVKASRVTVRGTYILGEEGSLTNAEGNATQVDVQAGGSFAQHAALSASVSVNGKGASYDQRANLTGDVHVTEGASFSQHHDVLGSVDVQDSLYTQAGGQISGGVSVGGENAVFVQKGTISAATPQETAVVVSQGASFTHEASGTTTGDVELNGSHSRYNLAGTITGDVVVKEGTFMQSGGTVSGGVSVTGGRYEQNVGKVVGALVVNGGTFAQMQAEGTVGSIDLQGGTVAQNGVVSGDVIVAKGTYTQKGMVNGSVGVSGGNYTLQSGGQVHGSLKVSDGMAIQQGATTGQVLVEGGTYTASAGADLAGGLRVTAGSVNLDGEMTLSADVGVSGGTVSQQQAAVSGELKVTGGVWKQSGGTNSGSITVSGSETEYNFMGGKVVGVVLVDEGASFMLGGGADMSGAAGVTVRGGSTLTVEGTPRGKITLALDSAHLVARGMAQMDVTMSGTASYDMGNQEMTGSIVLNGGSLQNAANFAGSVRVETNQGRTELGGMDARNLTHIMLGGTGSQVTGLKQGSTLTLNDAESTVLVSSANVGDKAQAMVVFEGEQGTVAFGNSGKLVVNFETSLLKDILDEEGNIDISFLFTNGSFSDTDLRDKVVLGSGLEGEKNTGSKTAEGGRVTIKVNAQGIWFASKHHGTTDLEDFRNHHKVVLDADMNIVMGNEDVTVRQLSATGSEPSTLTVTGDGNHALILENKSTDEQVDNGATLVNGDIVVKEADVRKAGGSKMTISGRISGDKGLTIEEGVLELSGTGNSFASLTFGDSSSLILSGDLTLDGGDSNWSNASVAITGGGTLTQRGGSLTMAGLDVAVNLVATEGAVITHDAGTITGNIMVNGGRFIHESGQVSGGVTISAGEYTLSGHGKLVEGAHVVLSGGSFSAEQGSVLSGVTLDVNSGRASMHNAILDGSAVNVSAGGVFTVSGETAHVRNTAVNLKQDATLELNDGAELILEKLHLTAEGSQVKQADGCFTGDITLDAGTAYTQTGGTVKANQVTVGGSYTLGATSILTNTGSEATQVNVQTGGSFVQQAVLSADVSVNGEGASYDQGADLTGDVLVGNGALFSQGGVITGDVHVKNGGRVEKKQDAESLLSVSGSVFVTGANSGFVQGGIINGGVHVTEDASFSQHHDVLGSVDVQDSLYTQAGGQISGGVSVGGENAVFVQKGTISAATPQETAVVVSQGASFTHEASGTTTGDVELNGSHSRYNLAGTITGDVVVKEGTFMQSGGTVSGGVSVTGGRYEQNVGKVVGALVVNGGTFAQMQAEGTVGSIDLQGGTVAQNGVVSGDVIVAKGTYTQKGMVNGSVGVSGGNYTLQSGGQVHGSLKVSDGMAIQQGATTGQVLVEGGTYTASAGADLAGGLRVTAGSVNLDGEMTLSADVGVSGGTVSQQQAAVSGELKVTGGVWKQSGGTNSGSITVSGSETEYNFMGGKVVGVVLVDEGASFMLGGGADMSGAAGVTVRGGSTLTVEGTPRGKITLALDSAHLVARGMAQMDVTMSGTASYDMGNQEMTGSIVLNGGSLQNAANFAGSVRVETNQGRTELGGMDARNLTHIMLGGTGSQVTGLKQGSTLTLNDAESTVLVSSANVGDKAQAMVVFEGEQGTVAFGNSGKLVVNFETSLLKDILDEEGNIDISFLFTNGSFSDTDLRDKVVLGSGLEGEKNTGSKTAEGGRVTIKVNAQGIWFASKHHGTTDLEDFRNHHKVVLDADMNIVMGNEDVTVRQLSATGSEPSTLTVTGDGNHALILENKSTDEQVDNGATLVNGDIVVKEADVRKAGGSKMTISGRISGDKGLTIEEGVLELSGTGNSFASLTFGDSSSLILSGDLTLDGGDSNWSNASVAITGGGTLTQRGGSLTMAGLDVAVNLVATEGAVISHGTGTITGNVVVSGSSSSFTQGKGKVTGNVELADGGAYTAENSGGIEGSVIASGAGTTLTLGSTVTGSVELFDYAEMKGCASPTEIIGHVILGDGAELNGGESSIAVDGAFTLSGSGAIAKGILEVAGDVTLSGSNASLTAEQGSRVNGYLILDAPAKATFSGELLGVAQVSGAAAHLTLSSGANVGEVHLSGAEATLEFSGEATVGKVLVTGSGAKVDMKGFEGGNTLVELEAGSLANAERFTGDLKIDTHEGGKVELGNLRADNITQVHVHSADGVYYTGLAKGSVLTFTGTDNMITVGRKSVGIGGEAEDAVLSFNGSGTVKFEEGSQVTLQFESAVYQDFDSGDLQLWFSNGNFDLSDMSESRILEWAKQHFLLPTGSGFEFSYFSGVQGSDARLTITARSDDSAKVLTSTGTLSAEELEGASKVIVGVGTTLSSDGKDATMRQLEGEGNLIVQNNASGVMNLKLRNENFADDGVQHYKGDTIFSGDVDTTQGSGIVNIVKEGDASLELRGDVKTNGDIVVKQGTLTLAGKTSANSVQTEDQGELDVADELTLNGETTLDHGTLRSSSHKGEMVINSALELGRGLKLERGGPAMTVGEKGALTVDDRDLHISALSGGGILKAGENNAGHSVTISGGNENRGDFRGTIDDSVEEIIISGIDTEQTFTGVKAAGTRLNVSSDEARVTLVGGSFRELDSQGAVVVEQDAVVNVGNVHLWDSSLTEFNVQTSQLPATAMLVSSGTVSLDNGAGISVHLTGEAPAPTEGLSVVLMRGEQGVAVNGDIVAASGELRSLEVKLDGLMALYYQDARVEVVVEEDSQGSKSTGESGMTPYAAPKSRAEVAEPAQILLKADLAENNPSANLFVKVAGTRNARTGADMLYHAAYSTATTPELLELVNHVAMLITSGRASAAQSAMAAAAGSVIPSLGAAHRDAAKRQIAATAAHAFALSYDMPSEKKHAAHVWVEGNGGVASIDRNGDEGGYEHRTWGASCGVDMALSKKIVTGVALTASYGDLEAHAADRADGDLDNVFLSLYMHAAGKRLHHSFGVMVGFADASFDRTVSMDDLAYRTLGSTNGISFGASYELAYDLPLNERKDAVLQPLVGLSVVTSSMDAYNESGADGIGLHVDDQSSTVTTLTAGARFIKNLARAVGFNSMLELRANIAVDMGDDRGEADVSFLGNRGYTAQVRSAELGSVGAQFGAGLRIPASEKSTFFFNGGADLRNGSTSWGANVGVQFGF